MHTTEQNSTLTFPLGRSPSTQSNRLKILSPSQSPSPNTIRTTSTPPNNNSAVAECVTPTSTMNKRPRATPSSTSTQCISTCTPNKSSSPFSYQSSMHTLNVEADQQPDGNSLLSTPSPLRPQQNVKTNSPVQQLQLQLVHQRKKNRHLQRKLHHQENDMKKKLFSPSNTNNNKSPLHQHINPVSRNLLVDFEQTELDEVDIDDVDDENNYANANLIETKRYTNQPSLQYDKNLKLEELFKEEQNRVMEAFQKKWNWDIIHDTPLKGSWTWEPYHTADSRSTI